MKQLGTNLVLVTCVIGALLAVLGLKRKFAPNNDQALLSQPSEDVEVKLPITKKAETQPKVLQARPSTGQGPAIVSPTSPTYTNQSPATQSPVRSPDDQIPVSPISISAPSTVAPLDPPDLIPGSESTGSNVSANISDETNEEPAVIKTAKVPVAPKPLPEYVLTGPEDSFWSISEQVYGSGAYYKALFRHNETKVLRPDQLRAGVKVRTPSLDVLRERYPTDFPGSVLDEPQR